MYSNGFSSGYHTDQWFIQPGWVIGSNPSKLTNNVLNINLPHHPTISMTISISSLSYSNSGCNVICLVFMHSYCIWHRNQTYTIASAPYVICLVFMHSYLAQKPDIYCCICSNWKRLEIQIVTGIVMCGGG